jgi:hypothetical protein
MCRAWRVERRLRCRACGAESGDRRRAEIVFAQAPEAARSAMERQAVEAWQSHVVDGTPQPV